MPGGDGSARGASGGDFPIVGIGAAAGGVAAVAELLEHLGSRPGLGVVIVLEVDASEVTSSIELLARASFLPVRVVDEGLRVERDRVYVVPANTDVHLAGGVLQLAPHYGTDARQLRLDRFFDSLAEYRKELAIGVLLSGKGAEGSAGMASIKAAGGYTFAQDSSAEYRSMPDSAVASGSVDFVLPPRGIAQELCRVASNLRAVPERGLDGDGAGDGDEAAFTRVVALLQEASGIDFVNYKPATLRRRAQRRLFFHRLRGFEDYVELLERDPAEAKALSEEVLIHVTGFFRDPSTFEALERLVFPELMAQSAVGSPIRVWVPGCSTGEEVYSLAMLMLEFFGPAKAGGVTLRVFGTDISEAAIDRARAGRYGQEIEQNVSPERLMAFFIKSGNSYEVRRELRDICVFARHDATRDPPFSGVDLISCRNLMIYLGPALLARTLSIFHYALKASGFLVLGSAETIHSFSGFSSVDVQSRIYRRSVGAPRLTFDFSRSSALSRGGPSASGPDPSWPHDIQEICREADRAVLARHAPPGVVVADDLTIVQFRGKTTPFLEPAPGAPRFELMRMAHPELRVPLLRAIDTARATRMAASEPRVHLSGTGQVVDIEVMGIGGRAQRPGYFVVLFRDITEHTLPAVTPRPEVQRAPRLVEQLQEELSVTRGYLESVIERLEASNEELRAANEEVTSSNEELRCTNEELLIAKEEIQATNEELTHLNAELGARNAEVTRLADDLSNVQSSLDIPIVLLGRDATIRRFAPAAARVLGLQPSHVGRPIAEVQGRLAAAATVLASQAAERLVPVERTLQDEAQRWYQVTVRPYRTEGNRVDGTVVVVLDIDEVTRATQRLAQVERERAERALHQRESEFRDVLTSTAVGIVMTDDAGRIVFSNSSAAELFGYGTEELVGESVETLVPERLRSGHRGQRAQYLHEPRPPRRRMGAELDVIGRRKDGAELSLEVTLTPLVRDTGRIIVSFITDITDRRESERRIREYQEKLRHMAFDAALTAERERRRIAAELHDRVGQALALAQIKLKSLPHAGGTAEALGDAVELIGRSMVDIRTLIFELSPPILYDLGLEAALSWLAEDLGKRANLPIEVVDDHAPKPLGEASAGVVFRAVRELLTNVIKHAAAHSAKVSLRCSGDMLEIDVEDDGSGCDAEAVMRPSARGGFGLFSVREQLQQFGGTLVLSSAERRGTRVRLRLPLEGPRSVS